MTDSGKHGYVDQILKIVQEMNKKIDGISKDISKEQTSGCSCEEIKTLIKDEMSKKPIWYTPQESTSGKKYDFSVPPLAPHGAFDLDRVQPWDRNLTELQGMFPGQKGFKGFSQFENKLEIPPEKLKELEEKFRQIRLGKRPE